MVVKIDRRGLGQLVHRSKCYVTVDFDDDFMGHTNNANYDNLAERIRTEIFLPSCKMNLTELEKKGYGWVRKLSGIEFDKGMKKEELILAELNVYIENPLWFHMEHRFIKQNGDLAGRIITNDFFVKIKEDESWSATRIPGFFIDAIRNV